MKYRFFLFTAVITACLSFLAAMLILRNPGTVDMVAINRIQKQAEEHWPNLTAEDFSGSVYPFSLIDLDGHLLFQSGGSPNLPVTLHDAVNSNDIILDFVPGGESAGKLLIYTGLPEHMNAQRTLMFLCCFFMAVFLICAAVCYQIYLNRRIIAPFKKLEAFAHHIAVGNLDIPLDMDQGHIFGAFTESFDIMREELKTSRHAEAMAEQSKKELVASLSHDIKTPVTSIKLITELLEVTAPEEYKDKLNTIYGKAEQIDRLVTNLFQSTLNELGELKVDLAEMESSALQTMLKNADYRSQLTASPVPGCLILTDPLRLEQVLNNVINNSYKYAGTAITVRYELSQEFLIVHIRDYGPGVPDSELPHLFDKFYRGTNARNSRMDGSGLGLFIASHLMERMNGEISVQNEEEGLCITLLLPLA